MKRAFALWLLLWTGPGYLSAQWYPALNTRLAVPPLPVIDDAGVAGELTEILRRDPAGPIFFLPAFTQCRFSCPVMVKALVDAGAALRKKLPELRYRVAVLSFDTSDTTEDLNEFRERENIPAEWKIFRVEKAADVRKFLDAFSYSVMTSAEGFNHPNQMFVFTADQRWAGSLYGTDVNESGLLDAYRRAADAGQSGGLARLRTFLRQPENWVIFGALGFLLGIVVVFVRLPRRRLTPRT